VAFAGGAERANLQGCGAGEEVLPVGRLKTTRYHDEHEKPLCACGHPVGCVRENEVRPDGLDRPANVCLKGCEKVPNVRSGGE
jgi:hypothetical protein